MGDPQVLHDVLASDAMLVTPEEAARLLRVGRTTVYALMKYGHLRPVHIGRSCRRPLAELERYVDGLTSSLTDETDATVRTTITDHGELLPPLHSRPASR